MASGDAAKDALFTPFRIKGVNLKNRFIMPAMQRGQCREGAPAPELAEYYKRRVVGGVSLVIGESCAVDHPSATAQPIACRLNAQTLSAWEACVRAVKEAGGEMLLQLWHEGAHRNDDDGVTLSPSGFAHPGLQRGHAASKEEIFELVAAYVRSAEFAQSIGAAGIELHCAHGYLLDQFLWAKTNQRNDGYGGSDMAARARLPAEILRAIRKACGDSFVLSVRFSQWKEADYAARIAETPQELEIFLGTMRDAGADVFHASTRRFWERAWEDSPDTLAGWTRRLGGLPTIAVGSVGLDRDVMQSFRDEQEATVTTADSLSRLREGMAKGQFDLVAVGRSLIGDPDWVNKVHAGRLSDVRAFRKADVQSLEWAE